MCVVGQLSRLELDSKVANVLKPTWELKPAALDVFLALEVGSHVYSNLDFGAILAQQHSSCGVEKSPAEVERQLQPWFAGASYSNHTTRPIDMNSWKRYRRDRPMAERVTRLQHHLSQFVHMRTCSQLIEAHEVREGHHFDVVLKMRDNTIAVSPFALAAHHVAHHAWTKRCVEWGGYNDKAMLIPRRHVDGALRSVSEDFFIQPTLGRRIPNSERLLKAVLDVHDVTVTRVTAEQLPLVDGRCSAEGWCLVEEGKDCRPSTWTWPAKPCEKLNTTAEQRQLYASRFESRAVVKKLKGYGSHAMDTA